MIIERLQNNFLYIYSGLMFSSFCENVDQTVHVVFAINPDPLKKIRNKKVFKHVYRLRRHS